MHRLVNVYEHGELGQASDLGQAAVWRKKLQQIKAP